MARSRPVLLALAALAVAAPGAAGQAVGLDPGLPLATRTLLERRLAAPDAVLSTRDTTVATGDTLAGSLVQVGARLVVDGTVTGDVTALGGEVTVHPGARIGGDLLVVGGRLYGTTMARVGGRQAWQHGTEVHVERPTADSLYVAYTPPSRRFPIQPRGLFGLVPLEYNGVDGLLFGVEAQLVLPRGQPYTELYGGPVFRTTRDDVGWEVGFARDVPRLGLTVGARGYHLTDTAQRWHRPDLTNSLAALLFANDDRAYFDRRGYALWVERSLGLPFAARVGWRDDRFESLTSRRTFALFADHDDWPDNPSITPGRGRSLGASLVVDRRNVPEFPTRGWYADARVDHWGFGGDFDFDWGQAEARGWVPLGGGTFVGARVVTGGRLGGSDTLAPQFWYRLGGAGTLTGYDALASDLAGDRMALANVRLHVAVPSPGDVFDRLYLVGLADAGDAWFAGDDGPDWRSSLGAGLAGHGRTSYVGVFGSYGFQSERWKAYFRLSPWF